jgi:HEPN domain-containing protein
MAHDPGRVAECRAWLLRALADLDSPGILLGAAQPRPESAVCHCRQAAEKAPKALLFWHDVPFRKTHDRRELGQSCVALDASLAAIAEEAAQLTPFAWLFRYPGEPQEPSAQEAQEALAIAQRACEAVLALLPERVRPSGCLLVASGLREGTRELDERREYHGTLA